MPFLRKIATLATVTEAARRYARSNPGQASKYLDQAAAFVDKQTKGKYSAQISGAAQKVKGAAGIPTGPAAPTTPGATINGQVAPPAAQVPPTPGPGSATPPNTIPNPGPTPNPRP